MRRPFLLALLALFALALAAATPAFAAASFDQVAPEEVEPAPEPLPLPPEPIDPPVTQPGPDGPTTSVSNGSVDLFVTIGADGLIKPGRPLPIEVTVSAKRLLVGNLRLSTDRRGAASDNIVIPIEVPGGSTKSYIGVVSSTTWDDVPYAVELELDGEVIADATVSPRSDPTIESVAVLPALASVRDMPEQAALALPETGSARLIPVTTDLLRAGPDALAVYDMIAVNRRDLESLGEVEQLAIRSWLAGGGRLLVDEVTGPLPGLPDAWQPTSTDWVLAGGGSVVLTSQELAAGNWSEVLQPTPAKSFRDSSNPFGGGGEGQRFAQQRIDQSLSIEAGFELPSVKWLIVLLTSYVLVVGPLGYFILRRIGRPLLFWGLVPLGAVAFTGLLWVTGSALRESNQAAHATYIELHDEGAQVTTHILVNSRTGGTEGISAPVGWNAAIPENSRGESTFVVEAGQVRATTELGPGQFGLLSARGPLNEFDDAIAVDVVADGPESITGTVTNNLEVAVESVTVFAANQADLIGALDPGETQDFTINNLQFNIFDEGGREWDVWNRFVQLEERGNRGVRTNPRTGEVEVPAVNLALWDDYLSRQAPGSRPLGEVLVVAWADEVDAPVSTDRNKPVDSGRTALIRRERVGSADQIGTQSVVRHIVRGSQTTRFEAVDDNGAKLTFGGGFGEDLTSVLQYSIPATAAGEPVDLDRLIVDAGPGYSVLQVFDFATSRWLTATDKSLRDGQVAIPRSAIQGGTVNIRYSILQERFWEGVNQQLASIRQLGPDERQPALPVEVDLSTVEAAG